MRFYYLLILCSFNFNLLSQVSLSDFSTYSQNFNSISTGSDGSAFPWSNNTTLAGWYLSPTNVLTESSLSSMNNTGAPYVIVSGGDKSLGGRASGTSPNNHIYWGVRLKNNTGELITSLEISYYGEQWSIAENQSNVNTIAVHWQKSSTSITSLTSGTWTPASSLNFTQLYTSSQSSGLGGSTCSGTSAQCLALNGNNANNRVLINATITVMLAPEDEIMLRWYDVNDAANDHHLQIDDLLITPIPSVVLPVQLTHFTADCSHSGKQLSWVNADETNLMNYRIDGTNDGVQIQKLFEIVPQGDHFNYVLELPNRSVDHSYLRLVMIDENGQEVFGDWVYSACKSHTGSNIYPNPADQLIFLNTESFPFTITIFDAAGKMILIEKLVVPQFDCSKLPSGMYLIQLNFSGNSILEKLIINH